MTEPSTSRRMPPAPDGFTTWLDYAVANMDTRTPYHDMLWECGTGGEIEFDRDDMYAAALSELDSLRQAAREADTFPALHRPDQNATDGA